MIGQTIAHYRILEKLGAGGMGEVYLADDTKLERRVALKFLSAALSQDEEARQRLLREAKSASKLNHPNITTIYAVETFDGRDFIVMEYVEGQNLSEYLAKRSPSLEDRLGLAIQIAEGLGKAHAAGVFHRDVKPSNVLIDADGRPKLLDFGLATFRGATRITQTGTTIGTAAYMSPEQASSRDCDHRSDLFSLGVVLYEMITGRLPFEGAHTTALMYSIVNDEPQPMTRYVSSVPEELSRIVSKALAKHPTERYQSAADLVADLKRFLRQSSSSGETATVQRRRMLAVLPFENLGPAEDEYFADGITEEIISRLASVKDIGVISRTSVMQFKGTKKSIREIGSDLGVDFILEGTVRWGKSAQGPSRVRITPQLIRVNEDTHMWSDRYDRVIEDIFDVQSDIAEQVTAQLNVTLADTERRTIEAKPTENVDAYHAYLRGLEYFAGPDHSAEAIRRCIQMFERAVALDPQFAKAYAYLSISHADLYWYGHDRTQERARKAKLAVGQAQSLGRDDAATPLARGFYLYRCESDFLGALAEFQRSLDRQPNHTNSLFMVAMCQRRLGKFTESLDTSKRVLALNPLTALFYTESGITACVLRRFDEANQLFDRSISLQPDQSNAYAWKAGISLYGMASIVEYRRVLEMTGDVPRDELFHEWFELSLAERDLDAALRLIDELKTDVFEAQNRYAPKSFLRALTHSLLGNPPDAREDYRLALTFYESAIQSSPEDPRVEMGLAWTLAGLGRVDEAFRHAQAVVDAKTVSQDTMARPLYQFQQAIVHAHGGDQGTTLRLIENLLSIPSVLSSGHLRLMPYWDSIRGNPEFERLINLPPKVF